MIFTRDIGIDLGTSTVIVSVRGKGIVTREPSVVAMDKNSGKLLKVGMAAQRMLGRTPGNIIAIKPISAGVISDCDMTERMLKELVRKAAGSTMIKPRILISVPSGITEVEERAVIEAGMQAGARKVYLMEAPVAAAVGAGLDISKPEGHMIIDIGAGTTDIAVVSLGGVVQAESLEVAGDAFDAAIIKYIKRKHNVLIGDVTAEELKKSIGCVVPRPDIAPIEVKGRDLMTGLPKLVSINALEMEEAFSETAERILEAIQQVLENTPPELVADVSENGITVTGGGSQIWGFDELIARRTSIPTRIADDPEMSVAFGVNKTLANLNDMEDGTINIARKRQIR